MAKFHIVQNGDNMWNISKKYNIPFDELLRLNKTKKNIIRTGDEIKLEPDKITERVDIRKERAKEYEANKDNISAIQGYRHNDNYVIIDKKNRNLQVFDKNNKLLYETSDFSTGASGDDYNTITKIDENGRLIDMAGNNSTPAGILRITGKGTYHGYPAFVRSRLDNKGNVNRVPEYKKVNGKWEPTGNIVDDNVASSLHYGSIGEERLASNGCVRIGGNTLNELDKYIGVGTNIYTLPEKEGSKFTLKGGNLNFTADNPYGEIEGDKRFWDDYNTNINKGYNPLVIKYNKTGNKEYDDNRHKYVQSLVNNKRAIQQQFGLTSDEYNRLVDLALGIGQQESKFGTARSYKLKQLAGDIGVNLGKGLKSKLKTNPVKTILSLTNLGSVAKTLYDSYNTGNKQARSRGITQLKLKGDNEELSQIYNKLGINENSINNIDKAALATISRLAYMYNTEVKGRKYLGENDVSINPYEALLYKWNGHNEELLNHTATPELNNYIRNVNQAARMFDLYEDRTYNKYD